MRAFIQALSRPPVGVRLFLAALSLQLACAGIATAATLTKVLFLDDGPSTRIVMDLNTSPGDITVSDKPGHPMTVSFHAFPMAGFRPINRKFAWPNLNGVFMENRRGTTQLFIKRNVVGTATVRQSGNRLVVEIPHSKRVSLAHGPSSQTANVVNVPASERSQLETPPATPVSSAPLSASGTIANGVRHWSFVSRGAAGPAHVNVLEVDPKNPAVEIVPALASNRMGAKANVARMVQNNQAVAGINGSFFKPDVGIPLGVLIINQELISGPIHDRVALGITPTNDLTMARIRLAGEVLLPDGRKVPVHNINQPRVKANQTVVYSSRWGMMAPKVPGGGFQVQIRNNHVTAVSTTSPLPIPRDGVVISGPGTAEMAELAGMTASRTVQLNVYTLPDWSGMKHAIGGGPWLIRDGRPYVDLHAQSFGSRSLGFREPRSAVGITRDGKMLMVTVDGRRKGVSVGMTLYELADLMRKLGAVQAMNLDGGSSTQMAVNGKTVNSPSSGNVGVSNALVIRMTNGDNVALQK